MDSRDPDFRGSVMVKETGSAVLLKKEWLGQEIPLESVNNKNQPDCFEVDVEVIYLDFRNGGILSCEERKFSSKQLGQ